MREHLLTPTFKARRYLLVNEGFPSPTFFNRRGEPALFVVDTARQISAYGMRLRLESGQPDLPVGAQAELKLDRNFYLVLSDDIRREEVERELRLKEIAQHHNDLEALGYDTVKNRIAHLINSKPTPEQLQALIASSQNNWSSACAAVKESRHLDADAKFAADEIQAIARGEQRAVNGMIVSLIETLNRAGFALHSEYAYSPKEGLGRSAYNPGADHLVTAEPLLHKRLKRQAHDPLCKPRARFNNLSPLHDTPVITCQRCLTLLFSLFCENQTRQAEVMQDQ